MTENHNYNMERIKRIEDEQADLKEGYHENKQDIAVIKSTQDQFSKEQAEMKEDLKSINKNTAWLVKIVLTFVLGYILTSVFGTPDLSNLPIPPK